MKSKLLLIFMFVGVLVFAAFDSSEPGWIGPQYPEGEEPTVTTDKDDYAPGEIAYISGSGWTLDTRVDIILVETPYQGHDEAFSVNVNSDGTWVYEFQIDERHLGVEFHLFATGNVTGYVAETFFTDGRAEISNVAPTPFSPNQPSSVGIKDETTITAANNGAGNINNFRVSIRQGDLNGPLVFTNEFTLAQAPGNVNPRISFVDIVWDGKFNEGSNSGEFVPDGLYFVVAGTRTGNSVNETTEPGTFQTVIVDNTNPTINLPDDIISSNEIGECGSIISWDVPTVTDVNPDKIEQIAGPSSGSFFEAGTTTIITYKATDAAGNNSTESFTVTVNDDENPTAVAQNVTIYLDADGNASVTASQVDNGSTDNCGVATLALDITDFDCSNVGDNDVVLTVTDVNGNSSTANAVVTVVDDINPTAITKAFMLQLDDSGNGILTPDDVDNNSFDNCSIVNRKLSKISFTCSDIGENTVTLTVTDASGNSASANATVTVLAPENPISVIIHSTVTPNGNNNVVIFDGAAASLGLPSSATLSASEIPSTYTGLTYQWFWRETPSGSFQSSPISTSPSIVINANGDFAREYKLIVRSNSGCIAENTISVISVEASCGKAGQNKVQVCHVTPNGKRKTICVSANAVDALLTNSPGSYVGSCDIDYRLEMEMEELVKEMNSKLIEVKWNEAPSKVSKALQELSHAVFVKHRPVITWSLDGFDPLQPGIYQVSGEFEDERFQFLKSDLMANVMVLNKPMAQDIIISNNVVKDEILNGTVVAELRTLDPSDNIHVYDLAGHPGFELNSNMLIWVGEGKPELKMTIVVSSTDRVGQTIEREFQLHREMKPSSMIIYPNPATKFSNILVNMNEPGTVNLVIYDAAGRVIHSEDTYEESIFERRVELEGISSGIYHVIVKIGNQVISGRLVKD